MILKSSACYSGNYIDYRGRNCNNLDDIAASHRLNSSWYDMDEIQFTTPLIPYVQSTRSGGGWQLYEVLSYAILVYEAYL